uniref:Plastocyanin-like domain-containing protein n=1 Tax=Aegilops tauschii subsp. strangulata TaxID=200361 RepID=A0A453B0N2_AEGTS
MPSSSTASQASPTILMQRRASSRWSPARRAFCACIINAAMNTELFVSLAGHRMTADAMYSKPFETTVVLLGPGQTTDVLVTAHAAPGRYYLAARAYASAQGVPFDNTTATAIFQYKNAPHHRRQHLQWPGGPVIY